uniref:HTH_Tnp_Tc3_1 domain-containing protein n=1 Tax=Heterorhabditis bacteriophora TaxID=37862 RepID=A0A1I7WXQ1_HETBA
MNYSHRTVSNVVKPLGVVSGEECRRRMRSGQAVLHKLDGNQNPNYGDSRSKLPYGTSIHRAFLL